MAPVEFADKKFSAYSLFGIYFLPLALLLISVVLLLGARGNTRYLLRGLLVIFVIVSAYRIYQYRTAASTLLFFAATLGHEEGVQNLLALGASADHEMKLEHSTHTPLNGASHCHQYRIAQMMVEANATIYDLSALLANSLQFIPHPMTFQCVFPTKEEEHRNKSAYRVALVNSEQNPSREMGVMTTDCLSSPP